MKRCLLLSLTLCICTAPLFAGITYTAVMKSDMGGAAQSQTGTIRGWASGHNGKVEFTGAANPMMPSGSYLITRDGARTLFLVDPARKTYSKLDVQSMLDATGGMMQSMKATLKLSFESPKIEKLIEENGGLIAGLPTRHYKHRTTYVMTMQYMGSTRRTMTILEEDIWATTKTLDPAMGLWLKKDSAKTGDAQLDNLIASEMNKVPGFPLKRVSVTTMESDGTRQTFRSEMEVTRLTVKPVPLSVFQIPATFKEQQPEKPGEHDHGMQQEE